MATKRKSKARRGVKIRVIDLKKLGGNQARLRRVLQQASRSKIALIVRNAPFKLRSTETAS
jgi:hypothetical protein